MDGYEGGRNKKKGAEEEEEIEVQDFFLWIHIQGHILLDYIHTLLSRNIHEYIYVYIV